jgi:hypothetical protein
MRAPERGQKSTAEGKPPAPKTKQAKPSAEEINLGERRSHVIQGGVVNATTPTPSLIKSWWHLISLK